MVFLIPDIVFDYNIAPPETDYGIFGGVAIVCSAHQSLLLW